MSSNPGGGPYVDGLSFFCPSDSDNVVSLAIVRRRGSCIYKCVLMH